MSSAQTTLDAPQADIDAVTRVAREYIDSYVRGDPARHARVYHPECLKRRYATDEASGIAELVVLSPQMMADYAKASGPMEDECPTEVLIDDISEDMASVLLLPLDRLRPHRSFPRRVAPLPRHLARPQRGLIHRSRWARVASRRSRLRVGGRSGSASVERGDFTGAWPRVS